MKYLTLILISILFLSCSSKKEPVITNDNETYSESSKESEMVNNDETLSAIKQRELDEEFIKKNIDVGKCCILRSGVEILIIDETDSTYVFFMLHSTYNIRIFNVLKNNAYKIIKRFEDIVPDQDREYITSNLDVGRDCNLKINSNSWALIIDKTDSYVEFLLQYTGETFKVSLNSAPKFIKKIRDIGSTD